MPLSMKYEVHSLTETTTPTKAKIGDREVDAVVPSFAIELVNDAHGHTYRFVSGDPETDKEIRDLFSVPGEVLIHFTRV